MTRGLGSRCIQLFVNLRLASYRKIKTRPKQGQNKTTRPNKKSPDYNNLGFSVPNFVVTRLGVEPRTY